MSDAPSMSFLVYADNADDYLWDELFGADPVEEGRP